MELKNLLSSALGDLARGFKKLKHVVDQLDISVDSETGIKIAQRVPPPDEATPTPTAVIDHPILKEVLEGDANPPWRPFLMKRCKWGEQDTIHEQAIKHMTGGELRADRFHNQWVCDKHSRTGWRSISEGQFRVVYNNIHTLLEMCRERIKLAEEDGGIAKFREIVGKIHPSKWARRRNFDTNPTYKAFRQHCIDRHKSLGSLR